MQICPNCNYSNRPGVVFCENCGTTLISSGSSVATRALMEKGTSTAEDANLQAVLGAAEEAAAQNAEIFPKGGILRIEVGEGTKPIMLGVKDLIIFGRRDAATGTVPDVDLTMYAGYRMGVSRKHSEIRYNAQDSGLYLVDLGSSNGTFLNGDRLIAHRPYRLRDGDQIRFGQLLIRLRYQKRQPTPTLETKS